jgi:hypothetical protein
MHSKNRFLFQASFFTAPFLLGIGYVEVFGCHCGNRNACFDGGQAIGLLAESHFSV